MVIERNWLEFE